MSIASFPARILKAALGVFLDRSNPILPYDVGAERLDAIAYTLAGLAGTCPIARVVIASNAIASERNAWAGAAPSIAHPGTGRWTLTYPANVTDNTGAEVALSFTGCIVTAKRGAKNLVGGYVITGSVVDVYLYDDANVATDGDSTVLLF
jgi:hypothetical protein